MTIFAPRVIFPEDRQPLDLEDLRPLAVAIRIELRARHIVPETLRGLPLPAKRVIYRRAGE